MKMHSYAKKTTKNVQKIAVYGLFFEISKLTLFFES